MSNLAVRTESNPQQLLPSSENGGALWSPFKLMRDVLGWDPFREMEPFVRLDVPTFLPRFEVLEDKERYLFQADMPAVKESDLNISLTGNRLVISGKRESTQQEKGTTYYLTERSYGEFTRSFTLPDSADTEHVSADLKNGVLTIVIPKKAGAKPKQIPLHGGKPRA